jgi:3-hydroxyacyl-CoA dehydrogenase
MADFVQHIQHGDVHVLRLGNPPVNTLRTELRAALLAGLDTARLEGARAVVLMGDGRMFSAGAEMTEFGRPRVLPGLAEVCAAIESFPGIVVAAIHGFALGGGLELALACHARVAAADAQLGLPEVKRGFVPGGGGTQRLPRIIGAEAAARMIVSGDPIVATEAQRLGVVDALIDGELEAGSIAWAREHIATCFTLARDRTDRIAGQDAASYDAVVARLLSRTRGQQSPKACAEAVRAAFTMSFEDGLRTERDLFAALVTGDQSQALRYSFFGERQVLRIPDMPQATEPMRVDRLVVLGGGTMGGGIAMSAASAGVPVTIVETSDESVQMGLARCHANWERSVASGRLSRSDHQARKALLTGSTDLDRAVACADLVIEAVFEDIDLKKQIFSRLDRVARAGAVLASNTSTLSIDEIASATSRPDLVVGMHFFSPANVMRLLETVRGTASSWEAIATATEFGRRIGKLPVLVRNCDGFVGNRMTGKRTPQAERLLLEGCLPQDIDRVMEAYGMAMGPLATGDLAGLDISAAVRRARGTVAPVADTLVALGRLGQKTGRGWYLYDDKRNRTTDPDVERIVLEMADRMRVRRRTIADEEILERLLLPMVNEGARILQEGIAYRPIDIDVIFVHGFGWPAFRGGPMFWADRQGLKAVREKLASYAAATGDADLQPAPLIETLAAQGGTFAEMDAASRSG